jgi:hypothetical protein
VGRALSDRTWWVRCLGQIADLAKRAEAEDVRIWFEGEFLDALAE